MVRYVRVRFKLPDIPLPEPVVQTKPETINEYAESLRLSSSTATYQTLTWRSGFTGTLEGVTVFTNAIDAGDYWTLSFKGRIIREKSFPVANTAIKEDYALPVEAGDTLVLNYYSQGTTAKKIDLTPRVRYRGEGLG